MHIFKKLPLIILLGLFSLNTLNSMEEGYESEPTIAQGNQSNLEKGKSDLNIAVIIPKKRLKSFELFFDQLPKEIRYLILKIYVFRLLKIGVSRRILLNLSLVNKEFKNHIDHILVDDNDFSELVFAYFNKLVEAEEYAKNFSKDKVIKKLIRFIYTKEIELIDCLLRGGLSADSKIDEENSILKWAVDWRKKEIVEIFLAHNADVNEKNSSGDTPLISAICREKTDMVKRILEYNADVNTQDQEGRTPLMIACLLGDYEKVFLLLYYDANVNLKDQNGSTALNIATINRRIQIIPALLAYGADVNIEDINGHSALTCCNLIINEYKQIASLLSNYDGKVKNS